MNAAASDQPPASPPESTTPGELLRRERQRRGISVQQAAEDLHLDVWVVEALEDNRYSALGAPVYSKGYLRKYAALLELSPEVVLARYESVADRPGTPTPIPIMTSAPPAAPGASLKKPLLIFGALMAAALLVWLVRFLLAPPVVAPVVAPPASENVEPPVESAAAPQAAEETTAEQTQPSLQAPAPAGHTPVASAPAPSGPQVRLRLEFTDTSWTEIYDATDRRLMFGLGEAGRTRNVSGVAPLRVTLGAASAVTAYVNDEQIVIPRREGRDASRFVIEADGGVRPGGL